VIQAMDASIIILTKNAGQNFASLLQHIGAQKFDGLYEVIVIDSGSTDDTIRTAKEFPIKITQIEPEAFHHGKTRNLGAELSSGRILVYITQDALPLHDNWLHKLTDDLKNPQVAMVVGRQIPWQTTKPPEKFFYVYNFPEQKIIAKPKSSSYYLDNVFISNVNSAIRKDVWQQFEFSETIIMAEDKEFANRILSAGWTIVYEPAAAVYHAHDFSLWSTFQRYLDFGISLKQGAGGLPKSHKSVIRSAFKYFSAELKYLHASGCLQWVPYSIVYEASKYLGLLLGKSGLVRRNQGQR
jgi:rhamnosyltransferase